jgi:hypothetical protein
MAQAPLGEKPEEPKPEDFGFTVDRVTRLENPGFDDRWMSGPALWAAAGVGLVAYGASTGFPSLIASVAGAYFIQSIACFLLEAAWRRVQADYRALLRYQAARAEYRGLYSIWQRTQTAWWSTLGPRDFEKELASLLRRRGLKVQWTGRAGDEGVDLRIDDTKGSIIIQCKAHAKPIGPAAVGDLYGTLAHRGARA